MFNIRKFDLSKDNIRDYFKKQEFLFITLLFVASIFLSMNASGTYAIERGEFMLTSEFNNSDFTVTNEPIAVSLKSELKKSDNIKFIEDREINNSPYSELYSEENLDLLAKIIAAEYRSQESKDMDAKVAVGIVVLNRTLDNQFPDTVREVIFQKNQFQPTFDGTWETIKPTEFDYEMAELAFSGYELKDSLNDSLYFMNPDISNPKNVAWFKNNLHFVGSINEHEFYK